MWTVFYGEVSDCSAKVYARWMGPRHQSEPHGAVDPAIAVGQLSLRGPVCRLAATLPTRFRFEQRSENEFETVVVDPCFWSADLPARYQLFDDTVPRPLAEIGVRQFGVRANPHRGGDLFFGGKRWVFRACSLDSTASITSSAELTAEVAAAYRQLKLGLVIGASDPNFEAIADWASQYGIVVAVRVDLQGVETQLARLSRYPSIAMAWLPADCLQTRSQLHSLSPNLVLVAELLDPNSSMRCDWAEVLAVPASIESLTQAHAVAGQRAVIAVSHEARGPSRSTLVAQRRSCEQLQESLIRHFDLAGYVVSDGAPNEDQDDRCIKNDSPTRKRDEEQEC